MSSKRPHKDAPEGTDEPSASLRVAYAVSGFLVSLTSFGLVAYHGWSSVVYFTISSVQAIGWSYCNPVINAQPACSATSLGQTIAALDCLIGLLHLSIGIGLTFADQSAPEDFHEMKIPLKIIGFICKIGPLIVRVIVLIMIPLLQVCLVALLLTVVCSDECLLWTFIFSNFLRFLHMLWSMVKRSIIPLQPPIFVPGRASGLSGITRVLNAMGP